MILICDDYNGVYVWVDDTNTALKMSPHFDYEEDAHQWLDQIKNHVYEDLKTRWEKE